MSTLDFTAKNVDVNDWRNNDFHVGKATVEYGLDFECRSWGIKGWYVSVKRVEVELEDGETLSFSNTDYSITAVDSGEPFLPVEVEIDKNGIVKVLFNVSS